MGGGGYQVCWGIMLSCEEEREYHSCGKGYNVKKGSNIIFPIILGLLGRISSWEGDGNVRVENQDFKNGDGGRISSCKELYTPLSLISGPFPGITLRCRGGPGFV